MRNSLLRTMKQVFTVGSDKRLQLRGHKIVAQFSGKRLPITNPWHRRDAVLEGRSVEGSALERFMSICHMSLNPYSPTWLTLALRPDTSLDIEGPLDGLIAVQVGFVICHLLYVACCVLLILSCVQYVCYLSCVCCHLYAK